MNKLIALLAVLGIAQIAAAQTADDYRGGWRAESGDPHIYQFSIRGEQVRGVYCTHCSDATTLAFIDGKLGADGIAFTVTHVKADGSTAYLDRATAKFDRGNLIITGNAGGPGGGKFMRTVIKDSRGPDGLPGLTVATLPAGRSVIPAAPRGGGGAPPPRGAGGGGAPAAPPGGGGGGGGRGGYLQPEPWKQITPADVVGVWLGFGVGVNKQYFIIRKVGNKLRGMVCGRCDNPYTMGALDDFEIKGDVMTFNILHEDWGTPSAGGKLPYHNQATVRVAANEMRLTTIQDDQPAPANPPGPNAGTSLLGPISIESTKGNMN